MTWTIPRTWVAGETVTATELNSQIRDNLNVISPLGDITALSLYTPALGAITTAPSLGAGGTISGAWLRIGALASGNFNIVFGTAPAVGSGTYTVTVPTPAAAAQPFGAIGVGLFFDSSTGQYTSYTAVLLNATQLVFRLGNTSVASWANSVPVAVAVGDAFSGSFSYAAA